MRLFLIFISLLFCGCSIKGSLGGLVGQYHKTKKAHPNLLIRPNTSETACDLVLKDAPKVYVVNGADLRKCLLGFENAVVYVWQPNCKSKICYPLEVIQQKCDTQNIDLFIVAEYYDAGQMNRAYALERPIFGIDTKHYRSNLTKKYLSRFLSDLTGQKVAAPATYYHFKDGSLVGTGRDVFDLFEKGSR